MNNLNAPAKQALNKECWEILQQLEDWLIAALYSRLLPNRSYFMFVIHTSDPYPLEHNQTVEPVTHCHKKGVY